MRLRGEVNNEADAYTWQVQAGELGLGGDVRPGAQSTKLLELSAPELASRAQP